MRAIEREEHAASVQRMRGASRIGLGMWPTFALLDLLVDSFISPGTLRALLGLRAAGVVLVVAAFLRLREARLPSPRLLLGLDLLVFTTLSLLIALQCLLCGGVKSPLAPGIILVMIGRAAVTADPWHRGLLHYGAMALTFPLCCGLGALFLPAVLRGFADGAALASFALNVSFLFGACGTIVFAGHGMWLLRRRSFEERNVGRYRLLRRIGVGGMGEVWVAQHQGLKREVALKILKLGLQAAPAALARFEREVLVTAELTHPNTIRLMDYGSTPEGIWYYAMELLSGVDLRALVKREGPLPPARALHLLRQACASLAEAHRRGLVHRDIKPENLFVTTLGDTQDFVKVLDFGIVGFAGTTAPPAKAFESEGALTVAGGLVGTPHYISPEAARGQATDARSDVYGLGAVLYFALVGRPPFEAPAEWVLLRKHVEETPTPPSQVLAARGGAALPADLEAVVLRCLHKDPAARYASAEELGAALDGCQDAGAWDASGRGRGGHS